MKDGIFYSEKHGRVVEHNGYSTRIFWNKTMIEYLKTNFATTLNNELSEWLGVSQRTMIRKARELGLEKDKEWLAKVWDERRILAHTISRIKGYPGGFEKGMRANPDGEFKKGHVESEETKLKRANSLKKWYKINPKAASKRSLKAWEKRRNKQ